MTGRYLINAFRRQWLRPVIESVPALFVATQKWRYRKRNFRNKLVDRKTDITIEGYPRSANSFCVRAFQVAQGDRAYRIANHSHSYAQVRRSVQLGIPTAVLIRPPEAAIVSMGALQLQGLDGKIREFTKRQDILWDAEYYVTFYRKLTPVTDQIVIVPFEEVLQDAGSLIRRVNARFGTDFRVFKHDEASQQQIFDDNQDHLSPSRTREAMKQDVRDLLQKPACQQVMRQARQVYDQWMKIRQTQH